MPVLLPEKDLTFPLQVLHENELSFDDGCGQPRIAVIPVEFPNFRLEDVAVRNCTTRFHYRLEESRLIEPSFQLVSQEV